MKLLSFNVKSFKSVKELGDCAISEKVTVLAGMNESGKTSILEALFKLKPGEKFEAKEKTLDGEIDPIVEANFEITSRDFKKIIEILRMKMNVLFTETQLKGLENEKNLKVIRNTEGYDVSGNLYQGILNIIEKEQNRIIQQIKDLSLNYSSLGNDVLSNSNIKLDGILPKDLKQSAEQFFNQFISSASIDKTKLPEINQKIETIRVSITDLIKKPSPEDIKKVFIAQLPNFILFKSFDEEKIKESMTFDEAKNSQFIKDLSKISNQLSLDEIIKNQSDDFWIQNFQEKFSATISKDFMEFWDKENRDAINSVIISMRIANGKVSFFISNPTTRQQLYPSQRSKGFQWFLSFYTRLLSNSDDGEDKVILIDEPGLFLHAKAQKSVLEVLNNLPSNDQIIYSTHSPYLIESDRLERVKLVEKDMEGHTHIVNKFYDTKNQDTLTPILTAIGHDVFSGVTFDGKKNSLVVEGMSDYIILNSIFKLLNFKENVHIIPMRGADSVAKYIPFFIGWGLNFLVIFDNDAKGKEVRKDLIDKWLVEENKIIPISLVDGECIEDLFTHEEYFKILLNKNFDPALPISRQIRDDQKVVAAKQFSKLISEGKITLSDGTKERFKGIIKKIRDYFPIKN